MNDFNYVELALKELEEAREKYKNGKVDLFFLHYQVTTLMFWLGAFLDNKKDEIQDDDMPTYKSIRFAWNVLKHDKNIFEIEQKAYIVSGVCGRMRCGQKLNFTNSTSTPTIIWKELDNTEIRNKDGLKEYNSLFKHKELNSTFYMIKDFINKYCIYA